MLACSTVSTERVKREAWGRRGASPWVHRWMERSKDWRITESRSDGKTRGQKINGRFLATGCEGRETQRWMSVVSVVIAIKKRITEDRIGQMDEEMDEKEGRGGTGD